MVIKIDFELPEAIGDQQTLFLNAARLSLREDHERSAIKELRSQYEQDHRYNRHHHHHQSFQKHVRDHKDAHDFKRRHSHGSCNFFAKHGHGHGLCHKPCCFTPKIENFPNLEQKPTDEFKKSKFDGDKTKKGFGPPAPIISDLYAPKDKGFFLLIIIGLFGLVHVTPSMFFMNATEYWLYKFRDVNSNSTDPNDRSFLQTNFASLNKLTVTAPGVICNFIAAVGGHKIRAQTRVFSVLFIHTSILISLAVFTKIDTDDWQMAFFIITMLSQLIMACAMALGGSGSMGLISKLPPIYMKAQLMGEGGAPVFSAILRLVSIYATSETVESALLYFLTGSVLMVITTILFYFATQTKFFKYYTMNSKEETKERVRNLQDFKEVLKILWPIVIISTIPMILQIQSITNLVVSEFDDDPNSVWANTYFITVCTFLIPSIFGLIGRGIFNYTDFDCSLPTLAVIVISREVTFTSLLLLSNAYPRSHLPVIVKHDWQYALVMAANMLTTDFVKNLNIMKLMRMVPQNRIELALMCNMFFMSILMAITSPLGVVLTQIL